MRSSHPNLFSWVKCLVEEKGLDIQERDSGSHTVFFDAVRSGNREIVDVMKYLEDRGLDLHAQCGDGSNAVFPAISFGNQATKLEVVKYLRERQVDFTLKTRYVYGFTVLDCCLYGHKSHERIPEKEIEVILECLAAGAEPWWGKESGDPAGYLRSQEALTWRMLSEYK
jgi:hypothetical protein